MVTTSMVKKLFALASVSALGGLVVATGAAGCTSETVETTPAQDAGTKDSKAPNTDNEEEPEDPLCYKEDPFDATALPYKKARVQPGKCSRNVTDVIDALLESNQQVTYVELRDKVAEDESQDCADCVFGPDGDSWAPVIMDGDQLININLGGCVEVVSGSEDCGRAFHQWNGCLSMVCKDCTTANGASACGEAAQSTACGDATQALLDACGRNVNSYAQACFKSGQPDIYGAILKLCVGTGTASDAGSDAGGDAGAD